MYSIKLTENDIKAINFVGYRYGWSDFLSVFLPVKKDDEFYYIDLDESEAFGLHNALEEDDLMIPMLSPSSILHQSLIKFYNSVV
jgi:hypothetical protein